MSFDIYSKDGAEEVFVRTVNGTGPDEGGDVVVAGGGGDLPFISVMDYGATGDGVTDDRAAIVATIAAAVTAGADVHFPAGTYVKAGAPIALPSNVTVFGAGPGVTTVKNATGATAGQSVFTNDDTVDGNEGIRLLDMTIDANLAGSTGAIHAVYMDNLTRCDFDRLEVTGGRNDGLTAGSGSGLQLNRMTRSRIGYVYVHHNMYDGVLLGGCSFNTIETVHGVDNSRSALQLSRYPIGSGSAGSEHNAIGTVIAEHSTGDPDINGSSTSPTTSGVYFHMSSHNNLGRIVSYGPRQGIGMIEGANRNQINGGIIRINADGVKAAIDIGEGNATPCSDNVISGVSCIGLSGGTLSRHFRLYGSLGGRLIGCTFTRGTGTGSWYGYLDGGSDNHIIDCWGDTTNIIEQGGTSRNVFHGQSWGTTAARGNFLVGLAGMPATGGGIGVIGIRNASVVPTANATDGGQLYVEAGALKWRGSSGTVTTIAPA